MSEDEQNTVPRAAYRPAPRRLSALWFLPVAALVGLVGVLLFQAQASRGMPITIAFEDTAGLEPGADIRYLGTAVGVVRSTRIEWSEGRVVVEAELVPGAEALAASSTRYWIAKPQIGLQGVQGLETILGPRYIEALPDPDGASDRVSAFVGLAGPPVETGSADAMLVRLSAPAIGSLTEGVAVRFRGIRVGSVRSVELAGDATSVEIVAAIEQPYDRLVRENSRFWVSGGIGVDFGIFSGLSVQAGSLDSLIEPAIGFATPRRPGDPPFAGAVFELHSEPDADWLEWTPSIPLGE